MPLTMRPIPHALNLGAPEIYGQGSSGQGPQGTQVLEDVNMASMVGTLSQLAALSTVRSTTTHFCPFYESWKLIYQDVVNIFCIFQFQLFSPRRLRLSIFYTQTDSIYEYRLVRRLKRTAQYMNCVSSSKPPGCRNNLFRHTFLLHLLCFYTRN